MEVVTINILVKLQPLVEVNHLVRRSVLLLPDEQDEFEEERNPSKMIKNSVFLFFSLKRNHTELWKIKMRPYLTEFHLHSGGSGIRYIYIGFSGITWKLAEEKKEFFKKSRQVK